MFLSRRYRPNIWPFYVLVGVESGLTVSLLALTGIAAPNLYRTKLWQDGADNGFNSSPSAGLYAAANYRHYTTPKVWSQFITNYNLVIAVLSMFLLLVKATMYMLHVLPPVVSTVLHAVLIALYSIAVAYQASSDMSDPTRPQRGPAWYITKSCSVTLNKSLIGYCKQAKATFACFAAMLAVFCLYFLLSLWSCFPSKAQKEEYNEKRKSKKLRWAQSDEPEPRSARSTSYPVPDTPGFQHGMTPATPRTIAFNTLGGTKDLPLRTPEGKTATQTANFALRSPGIMRTPMILAPIQTTNKAAESSSVTSPEPQIYFPPPPKESVRK